MKGDAEGEQASEKVAVALEAEILVDEEQGEQEVREKKEQVDLEGEALPVEVKDEDHQNHQHGMEESTEDAHPQNGELVALHVQVLDDIGRKNDGDGRDGALVDEEAVETEFQRGFHVGFLPQDFLEGVFGDDLGVVGSIGSVEGGFHSHQEDGEGGDDGHEGEKRGRFIKGAGVEALVHRGAMGDPKDHFVDPNGAVVKESNPNEDGMAEHVAEAIEVEELATGKLDDDPRGEDGQQRHLAQGVPQAQTREAVVFTSRVEEATLRVPPMI